MDFREVAKLWQRCGWMGATIWCSVALVVICIGITGCILLLHSSIKRVALTCVSEATPVVDAAYRYRQSVGMWPENLDDLVPDYLSPAAAEKLKQDHISYSWGGYDVPPMVRMHAAYHLRVDYFFPKWNNDPDQGWHITCEGDPFSAAPRTPIRVVDVDAPLSIEVRNKMIAELERRIKRDPANADHKSKVQSLMAIEGKVN